MIQKYPSRHQMLYFHMLIYNYVIRSTQNFTTQQRQQLAVRKTLAHADMHVIRLRFSNKFKVLLIESVQVGV